MLVGKTYDFVSHASMEPEETVFISSATESKIGMQFFSPKSSCVTVIYSELMKSCVLSFNFTTPSIIEVMRVQVYNEPNRPMRWTNPTLIS
jgi:hypothetical protein